MSLRSIRLHRFRNLADGPLDLDAAEVFLVGENGQGKTNLLEAIFLLCVGSSFRTRRDEELRSFGFSAAGVEGSFNLAALGAVSVKVELAESKKSIRVDDKVLVDRTELLRAFPCVVFAHEDIDVVKGPPDARRHFFNQTLCLHDLLHVDLLRRYNRLLRSRNQALKDGRRDLLDIYDRQIIPLAGELQDARVALVDRFNDCFTPLFAEVSGLDRRVRIRYQPSAPDLYRARDRDIVSGSTGTGPHRDRYRFMMDDQDFAAAASTGQIRLASLVLKSAQAAFIAGRTGAGPLLLVDDVLLELDPLRRRRFFERLPPYEQAFFTFLPDEGFRGFARSTTRLYTVRDGSFSTYGSSG